MKDTNQLFLFEKIRQLGRSIEKEETKILFILHNSQLEILKNNKKKSKDHERFYLRLFIDT